MPFKSLAPSARLGVVACVIVLSAVGSPVGSPVGAQASLADDSPFLRYKSAAQCVEALPRLSTLYWRDKRDDTVRLSPATDRMPAMIRDSMRLCATRIPVATTASADLVPRLQLALVSDDTVAVNAVMARIHQVEAGLPVAQRARTLDLVVRTFIEAMPSQITRAQEQIRALDALGAPAAVERMSAHKRMAGYAWLIGDIALAESEAKAVTAVIPEIGKREQINLAAEVSGAYIFRATIANVLHGRGAWETLLDSAGRVALPLTLSGSPDQDMMRGGMEATIAKSRQTFAAAGVTVKPVRADQWFGVPGDTTFPKRGRPMLAIILPHLSVQEQEPTFTQVAIIRRLHNEFAARGLDIVFMTATSGFFKDWVGSPEEEVEGMKGWFMDFLHLPIQMAVEQSQFGRLLDGRRQNTPMANEKNYDFGAGALLVGKDGVVKFAQNLGFESEQLYRKMIAAALAQ